MMDPDLTATARHFAGRSVAFPKLLKAVELAEGNLLKAVQCSEPTTASRGAALDIAARSAVHAMADYLYQTDPGGFVKFWAQTWAPQGAANDPKGLNKNWPQNVLQLWRRDTVSADR